MTNQIADKSAGYLWLAEHFGLQVIPHWVETRIMERGIRRTVVQDGKVLEFLPSAQDPGAEVFAQLEFALRREGVHLEVLKKVVGKLPAVEVERYVRRQPTGRYARVLWYLFEEFQGVRLELPDATSGSYVNLLDPEVHVTGPVRKVRRQRINLNLLGTLEFAPTVRWKELGAFDERQLEERCANVVAEFPPQVYQRAVRYLYAKESKSSHEIERETPDQRRAEQFIELLQQAWQRDFLNKPALVELQRAVVDPRFANKGWRSEIGEQIYVGESLAPGVERIHFAGPKPEDLDRLMDDFLEAANLMIDPPAPTVIVAAVVSFVFNFLHPFSDGNGRIHRFLLHHVLARRNFGPQGIILPVSAVILNRPREYDQALESVSIPLMKRVKYELDDQMRMTVEGDTGDYYRYLDCTRLVKTAIDFIRETIETELPAEARFLEQYDRIRAGMREIVDLPDRHADLFVRLCRQNGGTLSKKKRQLEEFSSLTDSEIAAMEEVIRRHLGEAGGA